MSESKKERLLELRRAPMAFEIVTVIAKQEVSPRLLRLRLAGDVLRRIDVTQAATSVRVVVPWPDESELLLPEWNGNEFLRVDGSRPALRTFTPLDIDNDGGEVTLEIVRHPKGAVSQWAERSGVGATAGLSGISAGYTFRADAERVIALGDETAIPAIRQLIRAAPGGTALDVYVEVVTPDAVVDLGERLVGELSVNWLITPSGRVPGGLLADVIEELDEVSPGTFVWAAGEASAMQRIRNHLFKTLQLERSRGAVRGYWKPERAAAT